MEEEDFQEFPNQQTSNCFLHASINLKIFPDGKYPLDPYAAPVSDCSLFKQKHTWIHTYRSKLYSLSYLHSTQTSKQFKVLSNPNSEGLLIAYLIHALLNIS